ncbi:uncharacterized protein KIAA0040 homolog [Triplophysa rosa]|uniref:KIAA0040 n=1 Tax=Triplophysa rosa TaxID=992332 RepID=A0A9W7WWX7_TRIRA|nr:uncharacterized protein KIAA0040 homolog [Triplophysa rosa]XP_057190822.1 uncharacterized protein KIAA0040 homolog [Triplophysa rosa]KAI7809688.1 hypothetical protein IRJ41_016284 [Triplophysa rosa]
MKEAILQFFNDVWNLALVKHNQSVYNTVCLAVLLTLPLVVILTSLLVCCHYCCCRRGDGCLCCCCCKGEATVTEPKPEKKKRKKNGDQNDEDLWISVKTDPLTNERLALTTV